jgi:hypothetical protein
LKFLQIPEWQIHQDPYLKELVYDANFAVDEYYDYIVYSNLLMITEFHPNLTAILLRLEEPTWYGINVVWPENEKAQ